MPITGRGWEMHVVREVEQTLGSRTRTVGRYRVYHDGVPQEGFAMAGALAEAGGPGRNSPENNGLRVEAGTYRLRTQRGEDYATWGYTESEEFDAPRPRPGFQLTGTGERTEILVHPGHGFLASVGCLNPCTSLPDASEPIDYAPSRRRVIALIEDMKAYLGEGFPHGDEERIPRAHVVIDGEP